MLPEVQRVTPATNNLMFPSVSANVLEREWQTDANPTTYGCTAYWKGDLRTKPGRFSRRNAQADVLPG